MFEFLTGLNKELDDVRGRVLSRSLFPSIDDAFIEVRREKARRKVMLGEKDNNLGLVEGSTLTIQNTSTNKNSGEQRGFCKEE